MSEKISRSRPTDFALKAWLGTAGTRGWSVSYGHETDRTSQFPFRCGPAIVKSEEARRRAIVEGQSAVFRVESQSSEPAYPYPSYSLSQLQAVTRNWDFIDKAAAFYRVEADLVRAVAWLESTHGWYDVFFPRINKSIRPMNIYADLWSDLGVSRQALGDASTNIEVGIFILAELWKRTEEPSIAKVATLYNYLGAERISGYGKTVEFYARERPWESLQEFKERQERDRALKQ